MINIDENQCTHCGLCSVVCPLNVFEYMEGTVPIIVQSDNCIGCGQCLCICNSDAISNKYVTNLEYINQYQPVIRTESSDNTFTELMHNRHSTRDFIKSIPPKEDVNKILDSVLYAPSAHNNHKVFVTTIYKGDMYDQLCTHTVKTFSRIEWFVHLPIIKNIVSLISPETYKELIGLKAAVDLLIDDDRADVQRVTHEAPILLVVHTKKGVSTATIDGVLAAGNMVYMAHSLGYGTLFLGFLTYSLSRKRKLLRKMEIPKRHQVNAVVALGYPKYKFSKYLNKSYNY